MAATEESPATGLIPMGNGTNLARPSVADAVAHEVQHLILNGSLPPGSPIREVALAEQFGVSRRTARQAIEILDRIGLVNQEPHKRTTVATLSADDVRDLYTVRRTVEAAGALSVDRSPQARVAAVRAKVIALEAACASGDSAEITRRDLEFHTSVVGLLGSRRTDRFFAEIGTEMLFAISLIEATHHESRLQPAELVAEHREIADAIASRNAPLAAALVIAHADKNEAMLLASLVEGAAGHE